MKRWFAVVALLLLLAPAAARAQEQAAQSDEEAEPIATSLRSTYEPIKRYLTMAADQAPDELYAFRPTPDVRTFGQLIGHIINAHYNFCAAALGERRPVQENFEQRVEKAALVEALAASFEYCDRAYGTLTDAQAAEETSVFGRPRPRIYPLIYNVAHDNEHYGNIVTYMRMNGLVPPSSQPRS